MSIQDLPLDYLYPDGDESRYEYQCPAVSADGDECILSLGHKGSHQRRPCDGTCDTCECDFWTPEELEEKR